MFGTGGFFVTGFCIIWSTMPKVTKTLPKAPPLPPTNKKNSFRSKLKYAELVNINSKASCEEV
jgi:hypothetical protein